MWRFAAIRKRFATDSHENGYKREIGFCFHGSHAYVTVRHVHELSLYVPRNRLLVTSSIIHILPTTAGVKLGQFPLKTTLT